MTLIGTTTLTVAAANIEFTSIPQDGTDLLVLCAIRVGASGSINQLLRFNGSATGFTVRSLTGNGSSATSTSATDADLGRLNEGGSTANTFSNVSIMIPNYTGSANKTFLAENVTENNAAAANINLITGLWSNTAAITSILVRPSHSGDLSIGSTVSLYKITKGSDGIVTVS